MNRRPTQPIDTDARLGRAWREHRRYVLDIALRMLGDLGDAEDVVQEAFTRLHRSAIDEIEDVRGWLVTVVSRLCLDQLRSARRRRNDPFDDVPTDAPLPSQRTAPHVSLDPADRVSLDDSVRLALQVVLQRLSPAERTAFVLHDVFQLPFEEIGEIVGRSTAAVRQLASRARRHIGEQDSPARFSIESTEERRVTETFMSALTTGDLDGLLTVLDPDVAGEADLGPGMRRGNVQVGQDLISRGLFRFLGPDSGLTLLSVPTGRRPTVIALRGDEVAAVVSLTLRDGLVHHIHATVDPAQLAPITAALRS